jgi:hypothetical protein
MNPDTYDVVDDICETNFYNDEWQQTELDSQENEKDTILDKINKLYSDVVEPFTNGERMVYNLDVFTKLTREKFVDWVISNNDSLEKLFRN